MWSRVFWIQALERAIKTAANTAVALLIADGASLIGVDWASIGGVVGMSALTSVLLSVGSNAVTHTDSPSLVPIAGHDGVGKSSGG